MNIEKMDRIFNWGILAPGRIARKFATELMELPNARIYAVASRDAERARDFAAEYNAERYYNSYEALVADPKVDVIYISSPHSFHAEHSILCLNHQKPVLCEKALGLNLNEVKEMVSCAIKNDVFFMEAMMVPQQPSYKKAKQLIDSGELGKIKYIQGWFGFNREPYDMSSRLMNPALGGGALLDIGLYPVFDVLYFLGVPEEIIASAELTSTGVDYSVSARFVYKNSQSAAVFASFGTASGLGTDLFCEKGTIHLRRSSAVEQQLEINIPGRATEHLSWNSSECGLKQEALEVMKCLDEGKKESEIMTHSMSLDLMKILDRIRNITGVYYPGRD